ncbi:MAG: hypothetical protein R2932_50445 [Caldilineaceae bacterium]
MSFYSASHLAADVLVAVQPSRPNSVCRIWQAHRSTTLTPCEARNHYTQTVALASAGLPAQATATITPTLIDMAQRGTATGTLALNLAAVAPGIYSITVASQSPAPVTLDTAVITLHLAATTASTPTLLAPLDSSTQSQGIVFRWQSVAEATHYRIEVATDATFSQPVAQAVVEQNSYQLATGLAYDQHYFWRVTPLNGCGAGGVATAQFDTPAAVFLPLIRQRH